MATDIGPALPANELGIRAARRSHQSHYTRPQCTAAGRLGGQKALVGQVGFTISGRLGNPLTARIELLRRGSYRREQAFRQSKALPTNLAVRRAKNGQA